MRLLSLSLRDFLAHGDLSIRFTPVTIVVGPNAAGKSSVAHAIAYALTGAARGVRYQTQAAALVHDGASGCRVELRTDAGDYVRTHRPGGRRIALDADLVQTCLWSWWPIQQDAGARQRLFAAIAGPSPLAEASEPAWCAEARLAEATEHLRAGRIDAAEAAAVELRREAKRRLRDVETPTAEPTLDGVDLAASAKRIDDLRRERDRLAAEHASLVAVRSAGLLQDLQSLEAEATRTAAAAAEIEREMAEAERMHHAGAVELASRERQARELRQALAEATGRATAAEEMVKRMQEWRSSCVLSGPGQSIICPIDEQARSTYRRDAARRAARAREECRRLESELAGVEAAIETMHEQGRAYLARKADRERLVAEAARAAERMAEARAAAGRIDEAAARIAEIAPEMTRLSRIVDAATAWVEWSRREQARAAEVAGLRHLLDLAEQACSDLADGGPVRRAAASGAETIVLPPLAADWGMGSLRLAADGSIELHGRPIEWASRSEQYRAGVLIQRLAAERIGWRIVDEADLLDADHRRALQEAAIAELDRVQSIICSTVARSYSPPGALPRGVSMVVLS